MTELNVTTYISPLRVVFFEDACFLNEKKCQNKADIVLKMPLFVLLFKLKMPTNSKMN
jgi:hypothetical protein